MNAIIILIVDSPKGARVVLLHAKRLVIFILTVLLTLAVGVVSLPGIVSQVKLGLDLQGGFEVLYEASPVQEGGVITPDNLRQTARILEKRVDALGTTEPEIWTEGSNRIRVRLAGVSNEEKMRSILKRPAELTVRGPDGQVELLGIDFKEGGAELVYDELRNPNIQVRVKEAAKLEALSTRYLGQTISFNLDEQVLTAPVVQGIMTNGICLIYGNFTVEEARELVDIINMGALPLKLTELFSQSVGATLGKLSLEQTVTAGIYGSILILLFLLMLYRIPGLVACITLITYSWLLLLCMNLLNATFTLPGIAAFVLGIGMAVDANIINYERFREELRTGKSPLSAMTAGGKRSIRTIMDANVTTMIAAFVLFMIGTGAIRGFAITLILSILLSIVTNVYFSQWLMKQLVQSKLFRNLRFYGVKPQDIVPDAEAATLPTLHFHFDYVKRRRSFFLLSLIVTVVGAISLLVQQLNYGVDFKAGTALDLTLPRAVDQATAERIVRSTGYEPSSLSVGGNGNNRISMRFEEILDPDGADSARIVEAFAAQFEGEIGKEENTVDPGMAKELAGLALWAVAVASVGILIYVSLRFEWRFALAAIIALVHDAFVVVSVFSLFKLEVNLPFIAAMLTIIGYSINDTIVIFDRIRENLRFSRAATYGDLTRIVNLSINQTLSRSVNTVVAVMFACVALLIWGSESIRLFSLAMTIGMMIGMYSSIYIASQVWLAMKLRAMQRVSREKTGTNSGESKGKSYTVGVYRPELEEEN